ncbi:hypothetical protein BOX15_Mlig022666g1 [Macrostomum lignano]|uniref:Uncharacterized protein n=1 Tax=Macrostomum lignano TaxID=282301 RepID=A0A267DQU0_9PLAT|nr:hypothetical protein BOX15_Mlig022666g1 [Macrostomum lignano]
MADENEYETDCVIVRTENIALQDHRPPSDCGARKQPDCHENVGAQTEGKTERQQVGPTIAPELEKSSDTIVVTRQHLEAMRRYYMAVKSAYFNYSTLDADSALVLQKLFEQTPEVLSTSNKQGYSPIESALSQKKWTAATHLLDLAARKNPRALQHRTATGDDALMLAVTGGGENVVEKLINLGCGSLACMHYNASGRNVLHMCALGSSDTILHKILASLSDLLKSQQLAPKCVTAALCTSDCDGCTPLHYMARENRVSMQKAVHQFAQQNLLRFDWDVRQTTGDRLTPLAMAARVNAVDACRFLLQQGLVGIDLNDHIDLWLQVTLSDSARSLLGRHCKLLEPINDLPPENLQKLQDGLQQKGLTDEFLLQLRTHWPDLPQLPTVSTVLLVSQNYCSSCRLVAWDILKSLGAADLAELLEGR